MNDDEVRAGANIVFDADAVLLLAIFTPRISRHSAAAAFTQIFRLACSDLVAAKILLFFAAAFRAR